jgi:hypothetical protein
MTTMIEKTAAADARPATMTTMTIAREAEAPNAMTTMTTKTFGAVRGRRSSAARGDRVVVVLVRRSLVVPGSAVRLSLVVPASAGHVVPVAAAPGYEALA